MDGRIDLLEKPPKKKVQCKQMNQKKGEMQTNEPKKGGNVNKWTKKRGKCKKMNQKKGEM